MSGVDLTDGTNDSKRCLGCNESTGRDNQMELLTEIEKKITEIASNGGTPFSCWC